MPTFTTIALETLLEHRIGNSYSKETEALQLKQPKSPPPPSAQAFCGDNYENEPKQLILAPPKHVFIKPELYITPELAPIPESSADSFSPSPYVVNHKRRGEALNSLSDGDALARNQNLDLDLDLNPEGVASGDDEIVDDNLFGMELNGKGSLSGNPVELDAEFIDPPCDSLSFTTSSGVIDFERQYDSQSFVSTQGEFFDAIDDFSSEGSISVVPSVGPSIQSELHATRLSLLSEVEKREKIEDALGLMYIHWQKIGCHLSQEGLTFPLPLNVSGIEQLNIGSIEQFCQELIVTRFVVEAIGECMARAEAEFTAETIIQSKEQEISRLRDRLQYYETVNHEMSQRNQENIEAARRQRHRKRSQRRWIWGGIGLMVSVGASVVAYSLMQGTNKSLSNYSDATDR